MMNVESTLSKYDGFKIKDSNYNKIITTLEQSPSSIVITDLRGTIEYVNPKCCKISGYTKQELIGQNPRILKSGKQSASVYKEMWNTIVNGDIWRGEFQNKTKFGEIYWEYVTIFPIKDDDGVIKNYGAIKEDINIQKDMEKELNNRNKDLIDALDELKLTQTKLIQREQIAGIGQLAAGVAHEINNPLGFVLSNIRTLDDYMKSYKASICEFRNLIESEDTDVDMIRANLTKIYDKFELEFISDDVEGLIFDSTDGLERIEKIVRSLRSFSRIDQLDKFDSYDISEGITSTLTVARNEIKYDAEVVLDIEENIPYIKAIGGQLNQVFLNMIINSVQSIRDKRVDKSEELGRIKISICFDDEFVFVEIEDSGNGIKKENLDKIFQPFFTTKAVGKGTGLGLGIAYDIIVNKHHGEITVESEVGIGTIFKIKLPINQLEEDLEEDY